jgi:hypothetical protein
MKYRLAVATESALSTVFCHQLSPGTGSKKGNLFQVLSVEI